MFRDSANFLAIVAMILIVIVFFACQPSADKDGYVEPDCLPGMFC